MSLVRYFAYGSNMQTATFRGRRGIDFVRALPARVRDWRVVFDKPPLFPIGEAFANLVRESGAEALGVLYEISESDFDHVKWTEGVAVGSYSPVEIEVETISGGERIAAVSLTSDRRDAALQPSTRYMGMIIDGALEHGLPELYVDYLRTVPACAPSGISQKMRPVLDQFLKRR